MSRSQGIAIGSTWVLRPTLINEIRFGFSRGNYFTRPPNFESGCPEDTSLEEVEGDQVKIRCRSMYWRSPQES